MAKQTLLQKSTPTPEPPVIYRYPIVDDEEDKYLTKEERLKKYLEKFYNSSQREPKERVKIFFL